MLQGWWMPFLVNSENALHHHSYLFMAWAMMSAHGFLCSQCTISTMKKMVISAVWNIKRIIILWRALILYAHLGPMLCRFIIHGIFSIMSLTATGLILTSFLVLSTRLWSMMVVYFVLCYWTIISRLKRNILLILTWNALTCLQTCCYQVWLWISPSQVRFLVKSLTFATPSSLTMVLLHLFHSSNGINYSLSSSQCH